MDTANFRKKSPRNSTNNERKPDMAQEIPHHTRVNDVDQEQYMDRSFDLVARVRAAREAAQHEMEAFGDVSEYEIRKIYGQRTDITYDDVLPKKDEEKPSPQEVHDADARELRSPKHQDEDRRQSTFDFTASETAGQPRRKEEE